MSNIALGVIDLQVDFALRHGKLYVEDGEQIIKPIELLVETARENRKIVLFSCDQHHNPDPEFKEWPAHCIAGTLGSQMIIAPQKNEVVISKGSFQYSACNVEISKNVFLTGILNGACIDTIILVGLAYDFCVGETALDIANHDFFNYKVFIVEDCTRSVVLPTKNHKSNSLKDMRKRLKKVGIEHISFTEAIKMLKK